MASALDRLRNKKAQVVEQVQPKEVREEVRGYEQPLGGAAVFNEPVQAEVYTHHVQPQYQEVEREVYPSEVIQQERTHGSRLHDAGYRTGHERMTASQNYREQPMSRFDRDRFEEDHYNRRQEVTTLPKVTVPSKVSYSVPDKMGLSIIGVNDPTRVRLVKPAPLDVQPLVLNNIRDTTGSISARLVKIMHDTGSAVLPLRECNVFDSITSIPDFELIEVRGRRFASYTGNDYPTTYLETLIKKITDKILVAQPYGVSLDEGLNNYVIDPNEAILSRKIQIGGVNVEVPSLSISQMNYLYAYLRFYNCNVIDVENDYSRLVVGIDLEGLPCEFDLNVNEQR